MLRSTTASVPSAPVRIAIAANRASGGGLDLAPLRDAMPGAEIFDTVEAERIVAYAPERLVVAGGDGTIGAFAELAGWLGVPLAVIPAGTANDFASAHDLPEDLREATELAAT